MVHTATVSSSVHVVMTTILGILVTALCCYAFYLFRTSASREQTFTDAMKVVRASTEIVASLAERGVPAIRSRLEELDGRARALERKVIAGAAPVPGPAEPAATTADSDAAMLAARRAARAV